VTNFDPDIVFSDAPDRLWYHLLRRERMLQHLGGGSELGGH
jgi:hypothetical protein